MKKSLTANQRGTRPIPLRGTGVYIKFEIHIIYNEGVENCHGSKKKIYTPGALFLYVLSEWPKSYDFDNYIIFNRYWLRLHTWHLPTTIVLAGISRPSNSMLFFHFYLRFLAWHINLLNNNYQRCWMNAVFLEWAHFRKLCGSSFCLYCSQNLRTLILFN